MKRIVIVTVMVLLFAGPVANANQSRGADYRLLIYLDCSGSIPNELFARAMRVLADVLIEQELVVNAREISVRRFDDQVSLILLDERGFTLPGFDKDSALLLIRRFHGAVGVNASRAYQDTVLVHRKLIREAIDSVASYIREIKPRKASMTDIEGLLAHLLELRSTDIVVVVSDFQDENALTYDAECLAAGHLLAQALLLYLPSSDDLEDASSLRNAFLERKQLVENRCPGCTFVPMRFVTEDWAKLLPVKTRKSESNLSLTGGY